MVTEATWNDALSQLGGLPSNSLPLWIMLVVNHGFPGDRTIDGLQRWNRRSRISGRRLPNSSPPLPARCSPRGATITIACERITAATTWPSPRRPAVGKTLTQDSPSEWRKEGSQVKINSVTHSPGPWGDGANPQSTTKRGEHSATPKDVAGAGRCSAGMALSSCGSCYRLTSLGARSFSKTIRELASRRGVMVAGVARSINSSPRPSRGEDRFLRKVRKSAVTQQS